MAGMPTIKIADIQKPCRDREHNPPSHMVYDDGVYEHTCPSCGRVTRFTVSNPMLGIHPISGGWLSNLARGGR